MRIASRMKTQSSVKRDQSRGEKNIVPHDVIQSMRTCDRTATPETAARRAWKTRRAGLPGSPAASGGRNAAASARTTAHAGRRTNECVRPRCCVM